ncbi:MAG: hypothetical protein AAGN64_17840, partial [Bacteroidota bacterium]
VRVIDAYGCVTIDRTEFKVPDKVGRVWLNPGMKLRCYRYPHTGELVANLVDVPSEGEFFCEPVEQIPFGQFQGRALTPRERTAREVDLGQPSHERHGAAKPAASTESQATSPVIRTLPPRTEPAEVSGPKVRALKAETEHLAPERAREIIARRLGHTGLLYSDDAVRRYFEPLIASGLTPAALDEHLRQVLRRVA